jgi:hypothetical protein
MSRPTQFLLVSIAAVFRQRGLLIWVVKLSVERPDKGRRFVVVVIVVVSSDAQNHHPRATTVLVVPLLAELLRELEKTLVTLKATEDPERRRLLLRKMSRLFAQNDRNDTEQK